MPATHVRAALGAAAVLISVPAPGALALPSGGGGRASAPSYLRTWTAAFPAGSVAQPAAGACAGAAAPGDDDGGGGEMGDKKVALITGITGQVSSGPRGAEPYRHPAERAGRGGDAVPRAPAGCSPSRERGARRSREVPREVPGARCGAAVRGARTSCCSGRCQGDAGLHRRASGRAGAGRAAAG